MALDMPEQVYPPFADEAANRAVIEGILARTLSLAALGPG